MLEDSHLEALYGLCVDMKHLRDCCMFEIKNT